MIELLNLTKKYDGKAVVRDLSLSIPSGQTLALIGGSGSGKSTILKMINRLVEPSAGQVRIGGQDHRKIAPELLRRQIGYVIQRFGLFPHYTVFKNIAVVPRLLGWSEKQINDRCAQLLQQVDLDPGKYAQRFPHQLSGGQQQRVGLARALAADPDYLLMDEPFGALDPLTRLDIRNDLLTKNILGDKTVVFVTHDVEEAFAVATQICLLHEGEIQQVGTSRQLLLEPANDYVRRFFAGSIRQLAVRVLKIGAFRSSLVDRQLPAAECLVDPNDTLLEVLTKVPVGKIAAFRDDPADRFRVKTVVTALQSTLQNQST